MFSRYGIMYKTYCKFRVSLTIQKEISVICKNRLEFSNYFTICKQYLNFSFTMRYNKEKAKGDIDNESSLIINAIIIHKDSITY